MKKFLLFAILSMLSFSVFAQAAAPTVAALPDWVVSVLTFLTAIPKVGPVLGNILVYIGVVGSVFTALAICARAVLAVPMIAAKISNSADWIAKIDSISTKVKYYLDQLSLFNAKK